MNCLLPLLPPLPRLLGPSPPPPPSLKALLGETKRQRHESGAGRDPTLWGPRSRGGNKEETEKMGVTCDLSSREGAPPCCFSTCPCTQRGVGAFFFLLAPLQPRPWCHHRVQGRAMVARAEPWAGAHGCLEAARVCSWQSLAAGGGEWAAGGQGQPAV